MLEMMSAVYAATPSMDVLLMPSTPGMTVLLSGVHAAMPSTCSVYKSGWLPKHKTSSDAPCAVVHGNSRWQVLSRQHVDVFIARICTTLR